MPCYHQEKTISIPDDRAAVFCFGKRVQETCVEFAAVVAHRFVFRDRDRVRFRLNDVLLDGADIVQSVGNVGAMQDD
jgi:hypothetical protein